MQWNQPVLPELGRADYQPVRRDVVVLEVYGFGNSKPGAGKQRKKRAVSLSAQCTVSGFCRDLNDPADLFVGKNVRGRPRPLLFSKDLGRNLMTRIFGVKIYRETSNVTQSASALNG